MQNQPYYPPYQQPEPKKKSLTWLWITLAVIGVLLCSCISLGAIASGSHQTASTTQVARDAPTSITTVAHVATQQPIVPTPTKERMPTATPRPVPTVAAKPTPVPTHQPIRVPTHVPRPVPTPKPTGLDGNPWGYDFNQGTPITNPPATFCNYFPCIASFWNGQGYVIECQDGTFSKSGGRSGSCSRHGGDGQMLYSH